MRWRKVGSSITQSGWLKKTPSIFSRAPTICSDSQKVVLIRWLSSPWKMTISNLHPNHHPVAPELVRLSGVRPAEFVRWKVLGIMSGQMEVSHVTGEIRQEDRVTDIKSQ